jgi:hypothetical protein
MTSGSV